MLTSSIDANFFVIIITIIVKILSLTSPFFLSFKSPHSVEQQCPHILSILNFCTFFLGLKLKIRASEWQHFTVYRSTFVKVVTYFHFSFFSAMMYNKCDVFVCGHKWKCNSTETDSLFSFHQYYRALHPYVPFHFLYFISVCWCYTVSWMQDRYCTKLYCYWLKNVIKSCLRSVCVSSYTCHKMFHRSSNYLQYCVVRSAGNNWKSKDACQIPDFDKSSLKLGLKYCDVFLQLWMLGENLKIKHN